MNLFFNLLCGSVLISFSFASISSFEFGLLLKDYTKSLEFISLGEVFFSNPESGEHFKVLLGRSVSNAFQSRMQSDSELTCKIEDKFQSRLNPRETRYFLSGDVFLYVNIYNNNCSMDVSRIQRKLWIELLFTSIPFSILIEKISAQEDKPLR